MTDDLDLRMLDRDHRPDPAFRADLAARLRQLLEDPAHTSPAAEEAPDTEGMIELIDTTTKPERTPGGRRLFVAAAGFLVLAGAFAAVVALGGDDDVDTAATVTGGTDSSVVTDDGATSVVLDDGFDDDTYAWLSDVPATIEGGLYTWTVTPPGQSLRSWPDQATDLVDMEVEAGVASTDSDSVIGVRCRQGPDEATWSYYFRLGPDRALIGVQPPEATGAPFEVLADTTRERDAAPFTLTARCLDVDGVSRLTLLVDGVEVLAATYDDPIPAGIGSLEVQAGASGTPSSVAFDRFVVREVTG